MDYIQTKAQDGVEKNAYITDNLGQVGTDPVCRGLLPKRPLAVLCEQLVGLGKGALAGLVAEGAEGVLEDVGGVGGADEGDGAAVAELEVLGQELRAGEDDGALGQHVAHAPAYFLLGAAVHHGVRGHVEEEEVALLCAQDALVHQALGQALPHLLELIANFHQVPGLACCGELPRVRPLVSMTRWDGLRWWVVADNDGKGHCVQESCSKGAEKRAYRSAGRSMN